MSTDNDTSTQANGQGQVTKEAPVLTASGQPVYAKIPRALLRDPSVSRDARLLWTILEDHTSKENHVPWPSQETLAKFMGCKERAIRNWLTELVEAGWLAVIPRPGRSNLHQINWHGPRNPGSTPVDNDATPAQPCHPPRHSHAAPPGTTVPTKKYQEEEPLKNPPPVSRETREGPVENRWEGCDELTRTTVIAIARTLGLQDHRLELAPIVAAALQTSDPQTVHDQACQGSMNGTRDPVAVVRHRLTVPDVKRKTSSTRVR